MLVAILLCIAIVYLLSLYFIHENYKVRYTKDPFVNNEVGIFLLMSIFAIYQFYCLYNEYVSGTITVLDALLYVVLLVICPVALSNTKSYKKMPNRTIRAFAMVYGWGLGYIFAKITYSCFLMFKKK